MVISGSSGTKVWVYVGKVSINGRQCNGEKMIFSAAGWSSVSVVHSCLVRVTVMDSPFSLLENDIDAPYTEYE